jgi:hypothetical protein
MIVYTAETVQFLLKASEQRHAPTTTHVLAMLPR